VDSPKPTLLYTLLYLFIVWSGPKIMKQRKAFKLTWALVPYNLAMALLNAYIAIEVRYFFHFASHRLLLLLLLFLYLILSYLFICLFTY
jgi:hypothetical protein